MLNTRLVCKMPVTEKGCTGAGVGVMSAREKNLNFSLTLAASIRVVAQRFLVKYFTAPLKHTM